MLKDLGFVAEFCSPLSPPPRFQQNGSLVRAYRGGAGIFEVCWNPSDSFIAACFADNTLAVVKFHGA